MLLAALAKCACLVACSFSGNATCRFEEGTICNLLVKPGERRHHFPLTNRLRTVRGETVDGRLFLRIRIEANDNEPFM